jgi:hypothetical protein
MGEAGLLVPLFELGIFQKKTRKRILACVGYLVIIPELGKEVADQGSSLWSPERQG